jgi:hypothetical protein
MEGKSLLQSQANIKNRSAVQSIMLLIIRAIKNA